MDFPFRHWSAARRRFPASLQVANTNLIENRLFHLERTFLNFSYSILFKGKGYLKRQGHTYALTAPCAYIVYPGETISCGPSSDAHAWNHLYFDFEAKYVPELERTKLIDKSNRAWTVGNPSYLWSLTEELCALSHVFPLETAVDRVDRLCERMIIESQMPSESETSEQRVIDRVIQKMKRAPGNHFDLAETARLSGMSEATFRRRWIDNVGSTPRRYLEQLRLHEACRILVETSLPVKEVAQKVGFDDEFYFSRRFHALMSISPRAYRHQHKT